MKRFTALAAAAALVAAQCTILLVPAASAQAAVSLWDRGANIYSTSSTDFGSSSFQQSLRNLHATGANFVSLVYTIYQSNTGSTDIQAGWNTPTDASLASAIDYAHSLGMGVSVTIHLEDFNNDWRANINPGDRATWYKNYSNMLNHVGSIAQAHGAEMMIIGVELVDMASNDIHPDNGQQWSAMIQSLRGVYHGQIVYDANSNNNSGDPFSDEKASIGFWNQVDMVGLSAYYTLNGDNSVSNLESQWNNWNNVDIKGFQQQVGKPILFSEIGYRSVSGAHSAPWNAGMGGSYDPTEQSNDYQAFLSYWNNYPYVQGVFFWNWASDPNAGGAGNTDYTPQNKPAQDVLTQWFGNPTMPGQGTSGTPAITTAATVSPSGPAVGSQTSINVTVSNTGSTLQGAIVDAEVRDQSGNKVFQQFSQNQTLGNNQTQTYTFTWTPDAAGTYTVVVGVFNGDWTQNYSWNGSAATVTVGGSSNNPPPPNNPPATTTPPTSTSTPPTMQGPNQTPPPTNATTDIWWPTDGASVSGLQPFKAMLENVDVSQYQMFWQVDNGQLNQMYDSTVDWPHKEAQVDLSGWSWQSSGNYLINFVSKDLGGNIVSQKSVTIHVQ